MGFSLRFLPLPGRSHTGTTLSLHRSNPGESADRPPGGVPVGHQYRGDCGGGARSLPPAVYRAPPLAHTPAHAGRRRNERNNGADRRNTTSQYQPPIQLGDVRQDRKHAAGK